MSREETQMTDIETHTRTVLLNRVISKSRSRAPSDVSEPTHPAYELLKYIEDRVNKSTCIEFDGSPGGFDSDSTPLTANEERSWTRLKRIEFATSETHHYAYILVERMDHRTRRFPVVNMATLEGRHVAGDDKERGGRTSHLVIRLPMNNAYDDGSYRCAIEYEPAIPRDDIEILLCRQLRRIATQSRWAFNIQYQNKKGKTETREYRYWPRLELHAELGNKLTSNIDPGQILQIVFSKRSQRLQTAGPTEIADREFTADLEVRVSAKQAPEEPQERRSWLLAVKEWWEGQGYTSKVYFRNIKGTTEKGAVSKDMAAATDLLMSPKKEIVLAGEQEVWRDDFDRATLDAMRELVDSDELWQEGRRN